MSKKTIVSQSENNKLCLSLTIEKLKKSFIKTLAKFYDIERVIKTNLIEDNEKLLPCPFCGSIVLMDLVDKGNNNREWIISCGSSICKSICICIKVFHKIEAVNIWNSRYNFPNINEINPEHNEELSNLCKLISKIDKDINKIETEIRERRI